MTEILEINTNVDDLYDLPEDIATQTQIQNRLINTANIKNFYVYVYMYIYLLLNSMSSNIK